MGNMREGGRWMERVGEPSEGRNFVSFSERYTSSGFVTLVKVLEGSR